MEIGHERLGDGRRLCVTGEPLAQLPVVEVPEPLVEATERLEQIGPRDEVRGRGGNGVAAVKQPAEAGRRGRVDDGHDATGRVHVQRRGVCEGSSRVPCGLELAAKLAAMPVVVVVEERRPGGSRDSEAAVARHRGTLATARPKHAKPRVVLRGQVLARPPVVDDDDLDVDALLPGGGGDRAADEARTIGRRDDDGHLGRRRACDTGAGVKRRLFSLVPSPVARALARVVLLARRAGGAQTGLVLVYHRIGAVAGSPARELNPPVAVGDFRAQLEWLRRHYRVVPAREIRCAAAARRRWQRYPVALTFDDDSPAHTQWGLPALRAAGLPATFFLSGAALDQPVATWWDRLQVAVDENLPVGALLPGDDIFAMGDAMKRRSPSERATVDRALTRLGAEPEPVRMTEDQVRQLAREHDVGFHTLRHDFLPALSDVELEEALTAGRERLESVCGRVFDQIAYPHGEAGPREARAARAAGFRMGFTTVAAPCHRASDPLLIGRAELGHERLGVFALRVERTLARRG